MPKYPRHYKKNPASFLSENLPDFLVCFLAYVELLRFSDL